VDNKTHIMTSRPDGSPDPTRSAAISRRSLPVRVPPGLFWLQGFTATRPLDPPNPRPAPHHRPRNAHRDDPPTPGQLTSQPDKPPYRQSRLKGARFALWKNARNLTERQQLKLARVQQLNQRLYRAYLLSQQLREIYRVPLDQAIALLDAWLAWARRCRLAPFIKLARTITEQRSGIEAAIQNGLSNARVEQVNTQLRLITRRAFGFHSPHAAIALAMLALGGLCPPLPGR
jgi:transposase